MVYNTRNRINDLTESQKEKKICFERKSESQKEKKIFLLMQEESET